MPTARDVLKLKGSHVHTVNPDTRVLDAACLMNEHRIGALCVVDESGALVGMFTERDILNRIVAKERDPAGTRVGDVMTSPVITCVPDAKLADCTLAMSSKKLRHLPVVEGGDSGKLVGMISTGDVMAREAMERQAHIEHLHDYLHGRM